MHIEFANLCRNFLIVSLAFCCLPPVSGAQSRKRRAPFAGQRGAAIVVDERLAALREAPNLYANMLQRMGRGRVVSVTGAKRSPDGLLFYRVLVTRRTGGWLQSEAVVSTARAGDDERLLRLIEGSGELDRIARARIFLDLFVRSPLRPAVLLLYGAAAEEAAAKLSREATRHLDEREMAAGGAPLHSYFLSYNGLDRYRKQGITFVFERAAKRFHYDGESWREILRRYPRSRQAPEARSRLAALASLEGG